MFGEDVQIDIKVSKGKYFFNFVFELLHIMIKENWLISDLYLQVSLRNLRQYSAIHYLKFELLFKLLYTKFASFFMIMWLVCFNFIIIIVKDLLNFKSWDSFFETPHQKKQRGSSMRVGFKYFPCWKKYV